MTSLRWGTGAADTTSTPPTSTQSASPHWISRAPYAAASKPDAQARDTVTPGTEYRFRSRAISRATFGDRTTLTTVPHTM